MPKARATTANKRRGTTVAQAPARPTARAAGQMIRITQRVVNPKRHTIGYMANRQFYTVTQIRRMAKQGQVAGVRVVGNHVQANPGSRRLVDLPTEVRGSK